MTHKECRSNLAVPIVAAVLGGVLLALPLRLWCWLTGRRR